MDESIQFRYARHYLLEGWDQDIVKNSSVLVVGVGALGCEIAKNLALVGVGRLHLVDMDTIELSNLSRQMLFFERDRGRYKAEVAAERIKEMNPSVRTFHYTTRFQDLPPEVLSSADVFAGGLDTFSARFALNHLAVRLRKVYIDGAATGFRGNVQVIVPDGLEQVGKRTPCMRCLYPVPPSDDTGSVACTLPGVARTREHCVLKGEEIFVRKTGKNADYTLDDLKTIAKLARDVSVQSPYLDEQTFSPAEVENIVKNKLPSIVTVNAAISAILSHEVLKALHRLHGGDIGPLMNPPYVEYSASYGLLTQIEMKIDPTCPVCSVPPELSELQVSDLSIKTIMESLEGEGIPVRDAVITRALDGRVLATFGSISSSEVRNREIIRITYQDPEGRHQREYQVVLEGSLRTTSA